MWPCLLGMKVRSVILCFSAGIVIVCLKSDKTKQLPCFVFSHKVEQTPGRGEFSLVFAISQRAVEKGSLQFSSEQKI